jgi:hypothetical protein
MGVHSTVSWVIMGCRSTAEILARTQITSFSVTVPFCYLQQSSHPLLEPPLLVPSLLSFRQSSSLLHMGCGGDRLHVSASPYRNRSRVS